MKDLYYILQSIDYSKRQFSKQIDEDDTLWHSPASLIPPQFTRVNVIAYDGKSRIGKFQVDNNWSIPGFPHDLFNNNIVLWRYTDKT
jgi:hypothetical protein